MITLRKSRKDQQEETVQPDKSGDALEVAFFLGVAPRWLHPPAERPLLHATSQLRITTLAMVVANTTKSGHAEGGAEHLIHCTRPWSGEMLGSAQ